MRRFLVLAVAMTVVPALAYAGARVTEGANTLKIRAAFDPPRASERGKPGRPIAVRYDYWARTTDGSRLPDLRSAKVFLGGAVGAFDAFPKCDESDARASGRRACPRRSRVGAGRVVAEIHLADRKEDIAADVTVYNGRLDTDRDGRPMKPRDGLLVFARVEGANVAFGFWAERRNRQLAYYNPKEDPHPHTESLYAIKELHLTVRRRVVRRRGRPIPFVSAPRRCRGRWVVTTTSEPYEGAPLTARHAVPCRKA